MLNPKYTVTDNILNNLTAIASAREVIEQAYLVPKWEAKLRRQALLHNTHSSTAIEGNKLSFEQVEALSEGKNVIATNKDKQEVLGYLAALEKISTLAEKGKIRVANILNLHRILTKDVMQNVSDSGAFRNRQAYYVALKTAQTNNGDVTQWLEYFTNGVTYSVNEAKDAVLKVSSKKKNWQKMQIALTPKQMKIVEYVNINGKVSNKDLQAVFKISAQAVHKELTKLVELKVIRPVGKGRALHYVLV
ncbi:MAG: hypothetical protein KKA34_06830 [Candidatus Omnitrophica bacterium]|nr:hypothetical protein [Candidatus Omnitrophota bacterium]